ncbi:MAG: hypothetical protein ACJAVN_002324, partial [Roseivirga sp.]
MVKNSKYIALVIIMVISTGAYAQTFSAVNRDMEITRVTLENFLKKWDGDPLLNKIENTEADYKKGKSITFTVVAPNADILMNTQGGVFRTGDQGMMDTFYTPEIISLQQERLISAIKRFITDFNSYIPHLEGAEDLMMVFDVKDSEMKKNGETIPPSPKADTRSY